MGKNKKGSVAPGANWLALKKKLPSNGPSKSKQSIKSHSQLPTAGFPRGPIPTRRSPSASPTPETSTSARMTITNELKQLREMVLGRGTAAEALEAEPGRYLALDCEMVGVGEDGLESSLARASLVDFHGRIVLDEFVRQRERVVDYRTAVSGIRPQDMVHAKPFKDVQAKVAELLAPPDRILVGHALSNDLTALLLAHPASRTRDTQIYAGRKPTPAAQAKGKGKGKAVPTPNAKTELTLWEKYHSRRIGLKRLTKEELGLDIQGGEHSSITDARAAMAIYRLHKRAWDASLPVSHVRPPAPVGTSKSNLDVDDNDGETGVKSKRKRDESFPGGGRRGVSSGLGTIVRERTNRGSAIQDEPSKHASKSSASGQKWWQTLGEGGGGSKGKLRT